MLPSDRAFRHALFAMRYSSILETVAMATNYFPDSVDIFYGLV
jgi:hypothetical protein